MEKFVSRVTTLAYVSGSVIGALSILVLPLTFGGIYWEINLLVTSVGVGLVALTAITSALVLLSRNFPIPVGLVIGTVLVVAIVGQLEAPNSILALLQQIAIVLLGVLVITRLLVESSEAKKHAH